MVEKKKKPQKTYKGSIKVWEYNRAGKLSQTSQSSLSTSPLCHKIPQACIYHIIYYTHICKTEHTILRNKGTEVSFSKKSLGLLQKQSWNTSTHNAYLFGNCCFPSEGLKFCWKCASLTAIGDTENTESFLRKSFFKKCSLVIDGTHRDPESIIPELGYWRWRHSIGSFIKSCNKAKTPVPITHSPSD